MTHDPAIEELREHLRVNMQEGHPYQDHEPYARWLAALDALIHAQEWQAYPPADIDKPFYGVVTDGVETTAGWLCLRNPHWFKPLHWRELPSPPSTNGEHAGATVPASWQNGPASDPGLPACSSVNGGGVGGPL